MENNARLADIYIKIFNKRTLTMGDLTFLSKYDPECFAKTCENIVYKVPETKKIFKEEFTKNMDYSMLATAEIPQEILLHNPQKVQELLAEAPMTEENMTEENMTESVQLEIADRSIPKMPLPMSKEKAEITYILNKLKRLEMEELPVQAISLEKVKNLLGNLYMELMFPHNDKDQYFEMNQESDEWTFNKKA
ncbi:MAG: hypothetical protein RSD28_08940 [Lachnospiraceae bacterium]